MLLCLNISLFVWYHHANDDFLVWQSPEQQITLAAVKSLLQFVKVRDSRDIPMFPFLDVFFDNAVTQIVSGWW
jgi:hypothetical protein